MDKEKIALMLSFDQWDDHFMSFIEDLQAQNFHHIFLLRETEDELSHWEMHTNKVDGLEIVFYTKEESLLSASYEAMVEHYPAAEALILVDVQGKYSARDVDIAARTLATASDALILGMREFTAENMPSKTKVGEVLFQKILNQLEKRAIEETPTSLRAISMDNLEAIVNEQADEKGANENMLLAAKQLAIPIKTVPLYTPSVNQEDKSYTERLSGLARIYQEFIKFTASSLFSTVVDLGLFALFVSFFRDLFPGVYIMYATIISRTLSIIVNYTLNNKLVFKRNNERRGSFIRYITLAIFDMIASGALVTLLVNLFIPYETLAKIVVDSGLFFIGYIVQRKFVFTQE